MNQSSQIYLDNPATSWPKPPEVARAMLDFMDNIGANPGRSGHRCSVEAARVLYDAREAVAQLFSTPDPLRVIFTLNVTDALNLALHGLLRSGEHVITTSMEHNSVMRPLRALQEIGLQLTIVNCAADGQLDPRRVEDAIQPNTVLIAANHASNVCGTILPVAELGKIARRHGIYLLVDAAQSAGALPLDMQTSAIDLLAFTGHKGLYGPTGTGGLVIGERVDLHRLTPLRQGGTGSHSEHERQPDFLPDRYESGTPNAVGLAGLGAAVRWLLSQGVETIRAHELNLTHQLIDGLRNIPGVQVYGTRQAEAQTAVVSFNIAGVQPSEVGLQLDEAYNILCRVGLHCAPAAHRTLGTFPGGTVRFGMSAFTTPADVDAALNAVAEISRRGSQ